MSTRARRVLMTTEGASSFVRDVDALAGVEARARYDLGDSRDAQALIEGLDGCFAVIAGSEPYTREVLGSAGDLRAIVRWGSGCDAIDLQAATEHGIAVVSVPGANAEPVADMALALMLAVLRGIPRLDRDVRAGDWRASWLGGDLAGASVGIVGLGALGRAVCRGGGGRAGGLPGAGLVLLAG